MTALLCSKIHHIDSTIQITVISCGKWNLRDAFAWHHLPVVSSISTNIILHILVYYVYLAVWISALYPWWPCSNDVILPRWSLSQYLSSCLQGWITHSRVIIACLTPYYWLLTNPLPLIPTLGYMGYIIRSSGFTPYQAGSKLHKHNWAHWGCSLRRGFSRQSALPYLAALPWSKTTLINPNRCRRRMVSIWSAQRWRWLWPSFLLPMVYSR